MAKLPLSIITGFLGSGKTTLLAEILAVHRGARLAVIVNEFGEVGLDHSLLSGGLYEASAEVLLLSGGCACCNKQPDLIRALRELLNQESLPTHILLESTGLANPAHIIFSLLSDPLLANRLYVAQIITCVDCSQAALHLKNHEAQAQLSAADRIVLTKHELVENLASIKALLSSYIPLLSPILKSELDLASILDPIDSKPSIPSYGDIEGQGMATKPALSPKEQASQNLTAAHLSPPSSLSLRLKGKLDWIALGVWLSLLLHRWGEELLRIKGLVQTSEGPVALNAVQHLIHPPTHLKGRLEGEGRLVFIFRDPLGRLTKASLLASFRIFLSRWAEDLDFEVVA